MSPHRDGTGNFPGNASPVHRGGWLIWMVFVMLIGWLATPVQGAAKALSNGKGDLRVMTYNVDEGTDFLEVQQATNLTQFLIAVGQTITQVRATNPPARMQAVAKQITAAAPMLVSLQELDQWSTGSFNPFTGTCGPVTLEFDLLQELLDALVSQGAHYQVAVQAQQYAFPPTPGLILPATFICAQVVNHVAILARTDLDVSKFQWSNTQSAQYVNKLFFPTPLGTLPEPTAWVSVDAEFHGKAFRFIGTHLESVDPNIRELQGGELRAGPANTSLPVILAMDSNAQAAPLPQDPTYMDFIAAGYNDAWSEVFPLALGLTCCQAQFVNNPVSQLYQRSDLILTLGSVEAQNIALFGAAPSSMTPRGLWPSDHAGVAAQLVVGCVYKKERGLNMRKAALVCFLILIPCSLRAQDKKGDWKALYGLRSGEKIELVETGMKKHVGTFSTVTEEAIQFREGSNDIGIRRESIARVTVLDKSHRLRNVFILGVVGAGAGAGIGAAASRCSSSNGSFNLCGVGRGAAVAIGAVVGLAGGAGVGAAIPSHPTIYRAEPAKSNTPH